MKEILMGFQFDSAFLPVLFSFGNEPHHAESSATNVATNKLEDGQHSKSSRGRTLEGHSPDRHPDISYQLQYVEENHRSLDRPWSIRRYGTPVCTTITLPKTPSISSSSSIPWMKAYLNNSSWLIPSLTSPNMCSRQSVPAQRDYMSCHSPRMCIVGDGV